jgi:hypothetical protein
VSENIASVSSEPSEESNNRIDKPNSPHEAPKNIVRRPSEDRQKSHSSRATSDGP